jgi:hypothetical protein
LACLRQVWFVFFQRHASIKLALPSEYRAS